MYKCDYTWIRSFLPPSCSAGRCDTCSGEGNDTDCRSGRFQSKASDPETYQREEFRFLFCFCFFCLKFEYGPVYVIHIFHVWNILEASLHMHMSHLLLGNTPLDPVEGFAIVTLPTEVDFNSSRLQGVCCHLGEYV